MQTRVQDNGESSDHRDPAYLSKHSAKDPIAGGHAELQDKANGMQRHSPGGDEHAPKVETAPFSEGVEDPDRQFNSHPQRQSCEYRK